jgi:hypothetical protein
MSRRLEFGRLRVLKEGDDAHAAQRAIARRLRGNSRRVAPSMLLLSLIGAAGIWLSLSELPHVRRIFIGELQSTLHPSCTPCRAGSRRQTVVPADPCVGARTKDLARSSRSDGGCGRAYRERRQWPRRSCDDRRRATVFDGTCLDANRPR